jgi:hypothetical protein
MQVYLKNQPGDGVGAEYEHRIVRLGVLIVQESTDCPQIPDLMKVREDIVFEQGQNKRSSFLSVFFCLSRHFLPLFCFSVLQDCAGLIISVAPYQYHPCFGSASAIAVSNLAVNTAASKRLNQGDAFIPNSLHILVSRSNESSHAASNFALIFRSS